MYQGGTHEKIYGTYDGGGGVLRIITRKNPVLQFSITCDCVYVLSLLHFVVNTVLSGVPIVSMICYL